MTLDLDAYEARAKAVRGGCAICGGELTCDTVDVGVGMMQCGPWGCDACQWTPDDNATEQVTSPAFKLSVDIQALLAAHRAALAEIEALRRNYLDVADAACRESTGPADVVAAIRKTKRELESALAALAKSEERATDLEDNMEALAERQGKHLEMIRSLSQSVPLDSEVSEALNQRGALLAEVGTLRGRVVELEAAVDELSVDANQVGDGRRREEDRADRATAKCLSLEFDLEASRRVASEQDSCIRDQSAELASLRARVAAMEELLSEARLFLGDDGNGMPTICDALRSDIDDVLDRATTGGEKVSTCSRFDPWGCSTDETGAAVNPRSCRVCGGTERQHKANGHG